MADNNSPASNQPTPPESDTGRNPEPHLTGTAAEPVAIQHTGQAIPAGGVPSPPVGYDLAGGLFEFISSQAEVMLAQYSNINRLLGPTDDWTAPGTLCEVLVRDLIRRVLPSSLSVDKGFIFGRRSKEGEEVHSPEIDVLIHDSHGYAPVYRLEDFVIVQPKSVRGVIQVKRTLDGDALKKAIDNLADAKEHLRAYGVIRQPNRDDDIFSAALFFGDALRLEGGGISRTYATNIRRLDSVHPISRPHFIGSLEHRHYTVPFGSKAKYQGYPSRHHRGNVALVTFLAYLTVNVLHYSTRLTLSRPADHVSDEDIVLGDTPPADPPSQPRPA